MRSVSIEGSKTRHDQFLGNVKEEEEEKKKTREKLKLNPDSNLARNSSLTRATSKLRQMYGNVKTQLDAFWHSYIPQLFSVKSFALCLKFPINEFFRSGDV